MAFGARYLFRSIGHSGQYPQRHWLQRRCKVNQNKSKKMHLWRQRRPSPMEALYLMAYVIAASLIPLTISGQNGQYQGRLISLKCVFFVCLYSVVKLKQIAGNPPLCVLLPYAYAHSHPDGDVCCDTTYITINNASFRLWCPITGRSNFTVLVIPKLFFLLIFPKFVSKLTSSRSHDSAYIFICTKLIQLL